jgi:integrase
MKRTARHAPGSLVWDRRIQQWRYFWYVDGHRESKCLGGRSQYPTEASAWRAIEKNRPKPASRSAGETVAEVIERFKDERMSKRHSYRRVSCSFLKCHILPRWGSTWIGDVQALEVEKWLQGLQLQPRTKKHLKSLLSILIDFAQLAKMIPVGRNPMSLVRIKGATRRRNKPRVLSVEEFHSLLEQLKEPFRTIAVLCICLGLRISECLALQWRDIDWLESKLTIGRSIVERNVDEPKTPDSAASFRLTKELLLQLQLWRSLTEFGAEGDWTFASPLKLGRLPYSYTGVWRKLKEAATAANLGWIGTHTFRHSYRAWMAELSTDLEVQKRAMRHTGIDMTLQYGALTDTKVNQVLEKVSGLVFANGTQNSTQGS